MPANHKTTSGLDRPVAVWTGKDHLNGETVSTLTIIIRTVGCHWARENGCNMCGYINDAADTSVSSDALVSQFEGAMLKAPDDGFVVKIFTSGSFLDENEVPLDARDTILESLRNNPNIIHTIIESRPEFVTPDVMGACVGLNPNLMVAIGVETSNDTIRDRCINKGFSFDDFINASKVITESDAQAKAYLLLKPPFLSEKAAVDDMLCSIRDVAPHVSAISLNLCNIQRGTKLEEMWRQKRYRPPWLWSAIEVLRESAEKVGDVILTSDPVAAGSNRGPHNCKKCDKKVAEAIRQFSITQNMRFLEDLSCDCMATWRKILEADEVLFESTPMI